MLGSQYSVFCNYFEKFQELLIYDILLNGRWQMGVTFLLGIFRQAVISDENKI